MDWSARRPVPSLRASLGRGAARLCSALLVFAAVGVAFVGFAPAARAASSPTPVSSTAVPDTTRPPVVFRPAEWETLSEGLPEEVHLGPAFDFRYNRVDGPAPTVGAKLTSERSEHPLAHALGTYAFSRERFLWDAGFEIPLFDPIRFRVAAAAYRRTATEDAWIVGEAENTIFALLARTDYRDHYEAQGFEGHVSWEPGRDFGLRVDARQEDQRSLETRTRVSLTGKDDEFRPNPPIEEGMDGVLSGTARLGPAVIPVKGGTAGDLTFERAGTPIQGDFDYGRLRATFHTVVQLSPKQSARARLIAGSTVEGDLPSQKIWHVGGIGTLRGEEYKKYSGDQFLLANAEYYLLARKNLWGFGFLDWGRAWFGKDNLSRQQFVLDGGVGLRVAGGPIAITAARNLQRSDAPILVGVRLGGTF